MFNRLVDPSGTIPYEVVSEEFFILEGSVLKLADRDSFKLTGNV